MPLTVRGFYKLIRSLEIPHPPQFSAVSPEADPIVRYAIDDAVDVERYPDGRYWRFDDPTKAARLFVVAGGMIQSIADIYRDQTGEVWWAVRRSGKL
jgi:hypothetical protein